MNTTQPTPNKVLYSSFTLLEKCTHPEIASYSENKKNCLKCGIHISNDPNCISYKSYKQNYKSLMDISSFSKALFEKKSKIIVIGEDNSYRKNRPYLIDWMFAISEKLRFSLSTIYLAINYLDEFLSKENIPSNHHQLFSLTSIFIAAKAIELDEKIPFISKLLSAASNIFRADDIKRAEHQILEFFDWDLQIPTLIDILEFYLSQGVLFSTDELDLYRGEKCVEPLNPLKEKNNNSLEDPNVKLMKKDSLTDSWIKSMEKEMNNLIISNDNQPENHFQRTVSLKMLREEPLYHLVKEIESNIYRICNHIIRDLSLLEVEPKILASACIAFLRKLLFISPLWNDDLKIISGGVDFSELQTTFQTLVNKYEKIFMPKQEFAESPPVIASKINLKPEIPQKFMNNLHYNYDFSRPPFINQNNYMKSTLTVNENNKANIVNYKNPGVNAYGSVNTIQSKHYNYPKSSSSILTVGQFNYIRYSSNNNIQ